MNIRLLILLSGLNACVLPPPPPVIRQPDPPPQEEKAEAEGIPYPAPDLQQQINDLGVELARQQEIINRLQARIQQLERNAPARRRTALPEGSPYPAEPSGAADNKAAGLDAARKHYRNGQYAAAAKLLGASEGGGNGGDTDRDGMYLLMQSHIRLGNCESAINIGNRYVSRFRNSPDAADALLAVGLCQWQMQQKDIARDTWRRLIRAYPDSPAAAKAAGQIKKR
ncbi:MAG: tetratricopeptide repeat protein [Neisseria sp.]|nr:tetratricopeptide repeat protein [Neisseria sp.]